MRFKYFFCLILCLGIISCSQESDPIESNDFETVNYVDMDSVYAADTLVPYEFRTFEKSNFSEVQVKPNILYCFSQGQIPVYATEEMLIEISFLETGEKVELLEKTEVISQNDYGMTGRAIYISTMSGTVGYVHSSYLLQYPFPKEESVSLETYALENLHVVDSTLNEGAYYGEEPTYREAEWESNTTYYEQGVFIESYMGYEFGSIEMTVPGIDVFQGLLLMDAMIGNYNFLELLGDTIPDKDYYTFELNEEEGAVSINRNENDGTITGFYFEFGMGCFLGYEVSKQKNGVLITDSGGC